MTEDLAEIKRICLEAGNSATRKFMIHCPNCKENVADSYDMCPNCGLDLVEHGISQSDLVGKVLQDKYRVVEKIGQGGMGVVYKVEHKLTKGKCFALKLVHPHLSQDPMVKKRFLREVQMALEFVHENAVQIRDFGQLDSGELYFTMDFIEGLSLKQLIKEKTSLPPFQAIKISIQILKALEKGHERGIVHRDIKPDNILIAKDHQGRDSVQVLDFGIAKVFEGDGGNLTQAGGIVGTPKYMSPEQIQGKAVDNQTDLYSVGVLLYEMITGQVPFQGENTTAIMLKHISAQPVSPRRLRPNLNLPIELEQIILKALSKDKNARYQDAGQFIHALASIPAEHLGSTTSDTIATGYDATQEYSQDMITHHPDGSLADEKEGSTYVTITVPKSSQILQYVMAFSIVALILIVLGGGIYMFLDVRKGNLKKKYKAVEKIVQKAKQFEKKEKWQEAEDLYRKAAKKYEDLDDTNQAGKYLHKCNTCKQKKMVKRYYHTINRALEEGDYRTAKSFLKELSQVSSAPEVAQLKNRVEFLEKEGIFLARVQEQVKNGEYKSALAMLKKYRGKTKKMKALLGKVQKDWQDQLRAESMLKNADDAARAKKWGQALKDYRETLRVVSKLPSASEFSREPKELRAEIALMKKHLVDDEAFGAVKDSIKKARTTESIEKAIKKIDGYIGDYNDHIQEGRQLRGQLKKKLKAVRLKDYNQLVKKAREYFKQSRFAKAKANAEQALQILSDQGEAYLLLGRISILEKNWGQALVYLKKAKFHKAPPSILEFVSVHFYLRNYENALGIIENSSMETPELLYWKGRIYQVRDTQKDREIAHNIYLKLLGRAPTKYPDVYVFLGDYASKYTSPEKAVTYYLKYLALTDSAPHKKIKTVFVTSKKVRGQILKLAEYFPLQVGKTMKYQRSQYNLQNPSFPPSISISSYTISDVSDGIYTRKTIVGSSDSEDKLARNNQFITIKTPLGVFNWLKLNLDKTAGWKCNKTTQAKVIGLEQIQIGSKKYYCCLRVKYISSNRTTEVWFAPNVGVIKKTLDIKVPGSSQFKRFFEEILKNN